MPSGTTTKKTLKVNFSMKKKKADSGDPECSLEYREYTATRQNTPVGESRSSLDPRDSDTTRCRGFSALTPRAHNEEDGRETILFLNAYFLYFAIASYGRFTCAFVFV